jgi:hypothetical protein
LKPRPPVSVKSTRRSCSVPPNAAASLPSLATTSEYSPPFIPPTLHLPSLYRLLHLHLMGFVLFVMSHSSLPFEVVLVFSSSFPCIMSSPIGRSAFHQHSRFPLASSCFVSSSRPVFLFSLLPPLLSLPHRPRPGRPSPLTTPGL